MITNDSIKKIVAKCSAKGHEIKVQDIIFLLIKDAFEDVLVPYKSLFGTDSSSEQIEEYLSSQPIKHLKKCITDEKLNEAFSGGIDITQDITFEQNKEALIKMLGRIEEAVKKEELDVKDALKMEKDIRVALNDKFGTSEDTTKHFVIVEPKFNHICEWTRHECFLQTEKYAREHWGLCKKNEVLDEIKKEYILTPKKKK